MFKINIMSKNKPIILKLGGSVITRKKEGCKKINRQNLERLSLEIARAKKKKKLSLIIVHGAGSFGHIIAKKFNLSDGYKNKAQIRAIAELHCDLKELNLKVIKSLRNEGLNTIPFQQSSAWKLRNKEIINPALDIIKSYLDLDFIPVLYGDLLIDDKIGFSILSGDKIVCCLAKKLSAQEVILGTDVDGIFNRDPSIYKNVKLLKKINGKNIKKISAGKSTAADVTGGMNGKIGELIKLAKIGIKSEIINISRAGILEKALLGRKNLGTLIEW